MNAIHLYRIAHGLHEHRVPFLPEMIRWLIFFAYNSAVPQDCEIGDGSRFGHGGIGVVLHPACRIGKRVLIGQGVTIGGTFGSGAPVIGDDVWIGPGARILGSIKIGCNVVVGANAVVVTDVADNSVVGGIPARLIRVLEPGALDVQEGKILAR